MRYPPWHTGALASLAALASCAGSNAADEDEPSDGPSDGAAQVAAEVRGQQGMPGRSRTSGQTLKLEGEFTQGGWMRGVAPRGTASVKLNDAELPVAADGSFFVAFDRDSPARLRLTGIASSGQSFDRELEVSEREWSISRVNVSRGRGRNLEAYWKKREPEYNAIQAARARKTGSKGWQQDFIWPVKGRISGYFGRQRIYRGEPGPYHSGIDIAPGNGVPFVAPADGVVVLARTGFSLEGGIVIIDHGAGLNSAFIHLSKIVVKEGQSVQQGQYVGNVGATGRATGAHLHWSLKWNDARLDPLLFVGPMN